MNDIPRGTTVEAILRSLAPPVHTDATINYDLISGMLAKPPVIQDSELDDDAPRVRQHPRMAALPQR